MEIKSYRDIIAWQKGIELSTIIYKVTANFPKHEIYSLTDQLRRAVVSISSNIAEGFGRMSNAELSHFLMFANGSLCEVETQIEIAKNLGYIDDDTYKYVNEKATECGKILRAFWKSVRARK